MKYKMALQGNMKWYVFAVFLAAFCFMFIGGAKASAYTIDGHYDDKATIWIDKAEITDDDMKLLTSNVKDAGLSKDQINSMLKEQVVGKYYDSNIYDDDYTYHKDACDQGQFLTAFHNEDKQKNGELYFPSNQLRINTKTNTSAGECYYLFNGTTGLGVSVRINDTNKSNIWFRRKDANILVRVDGRGGDFSNKDTGNPNVYQSTKQEDGADGRCPGNGYPNITIDDGTKKNEIANGQYETCDSGGIGRFGRERFGVNIDNRGPGGSGGEVVGTLPTTTDSDSDGGGGGDPCQSNNPLDMAWWACGVLGMVNSGLETATTALENLLKVNADDWVEDSSIKAVWSYFRAIASFTLLGVALVMIIGQALGND